MHTIRTERGGKIHEEIDPPQFAYPVGARDPYTSHPKMAETRIVVPPSTVSPTPRQTAIEVSPRLELPNSRRSMNRITSRYDLRNPYMPTDLLASTEFRGHIPVHILWEVPASCRDP